ncbi:MAG: helix-turn-helix transcriptional regulator [Desulfobacterales bacterium]|nr:helix-turn-helix transcriptional regulator [Desulfobacterales bacterium]
MVQKNTPGSGRQERYIQASILLGLIPAPSYGYELISTIQTFGFIDGTAPPGMIYRHLRQMEDDNLLSSQWDTGRSGAAKRIYTITDEGREVLNLWIRHMQDRADKLNGFIKMYQDKVG